VVVLLLAELAVVVMVLHRAELMDLPVLIILAVEEDLQPQVDHKMPKQELKVAVVKDLLLSDTQSKCKNKKRV
jgi:hypothetical protein